MRALYKISFVLVILLVFGFVAFSWSCTKNGGDIIDKNGDGRINVLCTGVDEVSNNTDTIILVSLDTKEKTVCLLHIPRDTYFGKDTSNNKINNMYSTYLSQSKSERDALSFVRDSVSQAFALPIDYYASFGLSDLADIVDSLGGVQVDIPCDMNYEDEAQSLSIRLKKGVQVLDGNEAMLFVRYRSTYVEGDIGRIDAQKIFISALFGRLRENKSLSSLTSFARKAVKSARTDIPLDVALSLVKSFGSDLSGYSVTYITLPGEAIKDDLDTGLWYYVLNREATLDVLKKYYSQDLIPVAFDREELFVNEKNIGFENIYFASDYDYKTYTDEQISQIDIKLQQ